MKNFGRTFGTFTGKQFKQFYQGTTVFFYGTYGRFVCYTQKVVLFNGSHSDGDFTKPFTRNKCVC